MLTGCWLKSIRPRLLCKKVQPIERGIEYLRLWLLWFYKDRIRPFPVRIERQPVGVLQDAGVPHPGPADTLNSDYSFHEDGRDDCMPAQTVCAESSARQAHLWCSSCFPGSLSPVRIERQPVGVLQDAGVPHPGPADTLNSDYSFHEDGRDDCMPAQTVCAESSARQAHLWWYGPRMDRTYYVLSATSILPSPLEKSIKPGETIAATSGPGGTLRMHRPNWLRFFVTQLVVLSWQPFPVRIERQPVGVLQDAGVPHPGPADTLNSDYSFHEDGRDDCMPAQTVCAESSARQAHLWCAVSCVSLPQPSWAAHLINLAGVRDVVFIDAAVAHRTSDGSSVLFNRKALHVKSNMEVQVYILDKLIDSAAIGRVVWLFKGVCGLECLDAHSFSQREDIWGRCHHHSRCIQVWLWRVVDHYPNANCCSPQELKIQA
ncbi:hypothetical protein MRX96_045163 [Rhipicephalus microplus]